MFLIILFHGYTHISVSTKIINPEYDHFSINQLMCFIFGSWGSLGVGVFFLISAHFTAGHSKASVKKIFNLSLQTIFWSLIFEVGISIIKHGG